MTVVVSEWSRVLPAASRSCAFARASRVTCSAGVPRVCWRAFWSVPTSALNRSTDRFTAISFRYAMNVIESAASMSAAAIRPNRPTDLIHGGSSEWRPSRPQTIIPTTANASAMTMPSTDGEA